MPAALTMLACASLMASASTAFGMSNFTNKQFQGKLYELHHLAPATHSVAVDASGLTCVQLSVAYSIHCFTENFDATIHREHHRYTHAGETRAFDLARYEWSLGLPSIVAAMGRARVYKAQQRNYTYVAQIPYQGEQNPYSLFFTLRAGAASDQPSVEMYIQSAYIKPLTAARGAQSWRFGSLLGQTSGLFSPPEKKTRPTKR